MFKHLCNTKITELNDLILCEEYILTFQISMQDFSIMDMLYCERNLCEPFKNLFFRQILLLLFQKVLQIASVCIVHNDAQLPSFCFIHFSKPNDVRMIESFHDFCFIQSLLFLIFRHLSYVNLLDDC